MAIFTFFFFIFVDVHLFIFTLREYFRWMMLFSLHSISSSVVLVIFYHRIYLWPHLILMNLSAFLLLTWLFHFLLLFFKNFMTSVVSHSSHISWFVILFVCFFPVIVFIVFILAVRNSCFVLLVSSRVSRGRTIVL